MLRYLLADQLSPHGLSNIIRNSSQLILDNFLSVTRVTRRPALCGTIPHWKVLSRNTQTLNAGRIYPAFQ